MDGLSYGPARVWARPYNLLIYIPISLRQSIIESFEYIVEGRVSISWPRPASFKKK